MKERTASNVHKAFVEEAKAHVRILKYAERAEGDGFPQIALMFRAIAASEKVHAGRHYGLLEGGVGDTDENLERAFHSETGIAEVEYRRMLTEAHDDDEKVAALIFSQIRDVEASHGGLYKRAMDHVIWERSTMYQICSVCGYVADGGAPENCPVCGANRSQFQKVD
jgi:rubrerythrin